METPIWKTPEFWRARAEEWRGPETYSTNQGICMQLGCALQGFGEFTDAHKFLEAFRPLHAKAYFGPLKYEYRTHRAALCDKIADHLEHENQTQPSSSGR